MQISTLALTSLLLFITMTTDTWAHFWPGFSAGLYLLPLLFPLLLSALQNELKERALIQAYRAIGESWISLLKWVIFLPILALAFSEQSLGQIAFPLMAALFTCYLLTSIGLKLVLHTHLQEVDEPILTKLLATPITRPLPYAFSLVASFCLHLPLPGLAPFFTGYALVVAAKPLYLTGLASLLAWIYSTYFSSSQPYLASIFQDFAPVLFLVPVLALTYKVFPREWRSGRQLSLPFYNNHSQKGLWIAGSSLVLLLAYKGQPIFLAGISALISFFYLLLIKASLGLLFFPSWILFAWQQRGTPPKVELILGFLAALAAAVAVSGRLFEQKWNLSSRSPWVNCLLFGILVIVGLALTWLPVSQGLASFPSVTGDWLGALTGTEVPLLIWVVFLSFSTLGILRPEPGYLYFAWGLFIPISWGLALLVGCGLKKILLPEPELSHSVGTGLITGDILASFLLLFN